MATSKKKKSVKKLKSAKTKSKKVQKKITKPKNKKASGKSSKKTNAQKKVNKTNKKNQTKQSKKVLSNVITRTKSLKTNIANSFKPLQDHILIRQEGESDRTPGGLYIPAIAQDKPAKGTILAIGSGLRNKKGNIKPLDVKVGEQVMYSPHGGSKITLNGEDFIILREEEVLGVLKD